MRLTAHATSRCSQRGIRQGIVEAILRWADEDYPVGGCCRRAWLSRRGAYASTLSPQLRERLADISVIYDADTGHVVTVMHGRGRNRHRR